MKPLVTVICLCYNHSRFVFEAIESVMQQTYDRIQILVVDDASTDDSVNSILQAKSKYPQLELHFLEKNVGNRKAFNRALTHARGEFIIDLAADDILLPNRIQVGVDELMHAGNDFGVHFSNAHYINEAGEFLYEHAQKFPHNSIPQGDVYRDIIQRYFICPPTTMYRKVVFDALSGYDESLSYEDFDFLIRASRKFKFVYSPQVLVKRRLVTGAMSQQQIKLFSKHARSTFLVCEKIFTLNRSEAEQRALNRRITYEIRLNLRLLNFKLVWDYFLLWRKNRAKQFNQ